MKNSLIFTNGPWEATKGYRGSKIADYVKTDGLRYDGIHIHNGEEHFGSSSKESEANANLIAYAPEMILNHIYFCKRCDEGSIRSKTTYLIFMKTILKALPSMTWEEIKEGYKDFE